jgi:hypothetical protein
MDFEQFEGELLLNLSREVDAYYALVEDKRAGLLGAIANRLRANAALGQLRERLRNWIRLAYQVAAIMGNGGEALTGEQNKRVASAIADTFTYLDGFIKDLPKASRDGAAARIAKYIPPVLQFASQIMAMGLPRLPIMPGDKRLICCERYPACKCRLRVVALAPGDYDVFWERHADDSCDTCMALSELWRPLRIRKGRIVMNGERVTA